MARFGTFSVELSMELNLLTKKTKKMVVIVWFHFFGILYQKVTW
jgi:hypothetical protein